MMREYLLTQREHLRWWWYKYRHPEQPIDEAMLQFFFGDPS